MANKYTDFQNGLAMALAAGAASGGAGVTEITKAEYDALSEEEKNNGKLYLINDYAEGGIVSSDVSGMESTVLWEGTQAFSHTIDEYVSITLNDSIDNYDLIVIKHGFYNAIYTSSTFNAPCRNILYGNASAWMVAQYKITNDVMLMTCSSIGSERWILDDWTLTKVTGLKFKAKVYKPENEYSLEEKRIGTWIDGKPLYQKTIIFDNPITIQYSGYRVTSIENLDFIVDFTAYTHERGDSENPAVIQSMLCYADRSTKEVLVQMNTPNTNWGLKILTIQYTKTTD